MQLHMLLIGPIPCAWQVTFNKVTHVVDHNLGDHKDQTVEVDFGGILLTFKNSATEMEVWAGPTDRLMVIGGPCGEMTARFDVEIFRK